MRIIREKGTKSGTPGARHIGLVLLLILPLFLSNHAFAQDDDDFPEYRPTPKIELSDDEKSLLKDQKDTRKYLKTALALIEGRLLSAEKKNGAGEFDGMLAELGGFHALIDTTLDYLEKNELRQGKIIETFKRYEIALRGFAPRVENVRRDAPDKYSAYITKLLKRIRDNRARAIEPFYAEPTIRPN